MAELKISRHQRDRIWKEIQVVLEEDKKEKIRKVFINNKNEVYVMAIKDIRDILVEYDTRVEKWDRLLHNGKTETEEREEEMRPFRERMEKSQKELDELFKYNPWSS